MRITIVSMKVFLIKKNHFNLLWEPWTGSSRTIKKKKNTREQGKETCFFSLLDIEYIKRYVRLMVFFAYEEI